MKYETFCVDYHPHTAAMAIAAAEKANELDAKGYKVLSFTVTNSGKGIILAEKSGETA
ncbi:MAG: hypothetical protein LKE61_11720 [Erysipelotrichaceae bacterium]|jgi:hypothetical protein|nr:hypothetical protein [Erysipelotrichaceae bacterium]MCI1327063.1 hypothetical protein [Solobacterium sp.]MCH4043464.1 hypothetical protein [Erysipelotrichaceae bacterium]MCH4120687.1 hypothetical protein [Erysipelotrichaceae bacterium]MCI1384822.1 hypothetical protein [Solobacterium sp.]